MFNKVDTANGIATIQLIDTVNVEVFYGEYPDENTKVLKHDEINPIPLTEAWLLKLGFNRGAIDDMRDPIFINGLIDLVKKPSNDFFFKGTHMNSVHQIQNLFYVITGKDLTEFKGLGIDIYA